MHRRYGDRLTVLAIDIQEDRGLVATWTRGASVSVPVLLDATGAVARRYEVTATPTVFVVSREGRLIGKALGNRGWTSERGLALLDRLVGQ